MVVGTTPGREFTDEVPTKVIQPGQSEMKPEPLVGVPPPETGGHHRKAVHEFARESREDILKSAALWPGFSRVRKCWDRWGWLHYICSQEDPWQHKLDVLSYCHNLLRPPLESWNLEDVLQRHRNHLFSVYGARSGARRGQRWRTQRARKAAATPVAAG